MKVKGFLAISGLALLILGLVTPSAAQEEQEEAPAVETTTQAEDDAAPAAAPSKRGGESKRWPLYFEVGYGAVSPDDLNTSIQTSTSSRGDTFLSFEDQTWARAAIGWKLDNKKGDFRLAFDGFKEDGYTISSVGRQASIDPTLGGNPVVINLLPWWFVDISDGLLTAERTPPQWLLATDDANMDGAASLDEVRYIGPDIVAAPKPVTDDLQNRFQTVDAVYGRSFGQRRFSARWWAGLRYFTYEGNLLAAAWLNNSQPGAGYTDGSQLQLLTFSQESTSIGPIASLEANFNFFDSRVVLYFGGMAGFMVSDLTADSGDFVTQVQTSSPPVVILNAPGRLRASRNKSTWQDSFEAGARYALKNGIQFEIAYKLSGYLDVVLMPTSIQIPASQAEISNGSAALFNTQDLIVDGWRGSVSFQF